MKKLFIIAVAFLAAVSCKGTLDLKNADMSIQLFGGGAYLPLCTSQTITLGDFLAEKGLPVDPVTGSYYIPEGKTIDISTNFPVFKGFTYILQRNPIGLVGEVASSFPVDIEMAIYLIDVQNGRNLATPVNTINAHKAASGEHTKTDLNLVLNRLSETSPEVVTLEFVFTVRHSGDGIVTADEINNSHLQATLALAFPEGVAINTGANKDKK